MQGFGGLHGLYDWQWLFLLEAAPAIVLGVCVLLYLDNGIDAARWLTPDQQHLLKDRLAREATTKRDHSLRVLLAIPTLWLFVAIYLLIVMGVYGINFWLPSIIQQTGVSSMLSIGWITAASYFVSAVVAVTISRRAEIGRAHV